MKLRFRVGDAGIQIGALTRVPVQYIDPHQTKTELTVSNGAFFARQHAGYGSAGMVAAVEMYREVPGALLVPRHYKISLTTDLPPPVYDTRPHPGAFVDRTGRLRRMERRARFPHHVVLRDQIQADAVAALLKDEEDKILALSCGKGKTIVSLCAAHEGDRFPILIIVHTNALMDQWRERIKQFYGLRDDEIGHVQAATEKWRGCPIAVGMLHSICMKEYSEEFYNYWRLVIFDETHRLGSDLFSRAAPLFPAERWGLSATVKREDGNDRMFRLHLGEVVFEDLSQALVPTVYFVETGIRVDQSKFTYRGNVNLAKLTTWLCDVEARNELILEWLDRAIAKGRTILVLGERLTQLHWLNDNCRAASKALHVGAMDQDERRNALKKQVVFATQHLAKEGLDRVALDTLFILVPFTGEGRLRQSLGRILREAEGKKDPLVFVFEDDIGIIRGLGRKMRRLLRQDNFEVNEIRKGQAQR
jgi:superfamily II DNA or RNA helicase